MLQKNKTLRRINFFISSFFIFLVHLPFVFAKGINKDKKMQTKKGTGITMMLRPNSLVAPIHSAISDSLKYLTDTSSSLYDVLKLHTVGLSKQVFDYSIKGLHKLTHTGKAVNQKIISIIDFSQPSANKRLYVIDLETKEILFNTYVAHGKNSGQEMATSFSNTPTSNKSSLGFYLTSHTYSGKNGYSLQLEGQEVGYNDKALERGIVMHAADYVNESYIQSQGWIGRSQGCPAVLPSMNKPIVETIKEGSVFFIYYPDEQYLKKSSILN